MYRPPKRRWPGLVAAYVALFALLAIPAVPIYSYVEPAHKLVVVRLCGGIVLAFTLHRLVKAVREHLEQQSPSGFEVAAYRPAGASSLAPHFEKLRDEVSHSLRDRSYFAHILRLRLLTLLERKLRGRFGIGVADLATRPLDGVDLKLLEVLGHDFPRRTLARRGLPLRTLQALVQNLEEL
jgi:hypothetical protein